MVDLEFYFAYFITGKMHKQVISSDGIIFSSTVNQDCSIYDEMLI